LFVANLGHGSLDGMVWVEHLRSYGHTML